MPILREQMQLLDHVAPLELRGAVAEVRGLALAIADLPAPVGSSITIHPRIGGGEPIPGEVIGFENQHTLVMPLGTTQGIRRGDRVVAGHQAQTVRVGESLLGRVLNGMGEPIDGLGRVADAVPRSIYAKPIEPLDRKLIDTPLATGVRAIDAMTPLGRGQRVGIFAAPGLGKSTLLGTMAKHTAADVSVLALVGERGREVKDFIENVLGEEGLARSVVVVATSDEPALLRLRAAHVATTIAEYFRDAGLDVLLLMDSITRFCHAQRQVGLAAGEPPATKGYPPSVFAMLPTLLERSGRTNDGSITGLYSVLVEGDDFAEPIADACRGVLDGHIQLARRLAERGHYPAIDVLSSISRTANEITSPKHRQARTQVVRLLSAYNQVEELLNIGAYAPGSNEDFDLAIASKPAIDQLLVQGKGEVKGAADFKKTEAQLFAVTQQIEQQKTTATRQRGHAPGTSGGVRRA